MTLRTGQRPQNSRTGVTLIELILVMAILATVMAVAVPQLKGFSAGRRYDAEWNRFVAALRYARNEAIARSVPVEIRFDTARNTYSLAGGYGFDHLPDGAIEHALPEDLLFEISAESTVPTGRSNSTTTGATLRSTMNAAALTPSVTASSTASTAPAIAASGTGAAADTESILFWPDGTVDNASPAEIRITERTGPFSKSVQKNSVLGYAVPAEGLPNAQAPK